MRKPVHTKKSRLHTDIVNHTPASTERSTNMQLLVTLLLTFVCVIMPGIAQNATLTSATPFAPTDHVVPDVAAPPASVEEDEVPASGSAVEEPEISSTPSTPGSISFGELFKGLPTSVQECGKYMGSQRPNDREFDCDSLGKACSKSQGSLPLSYEGDKPDDPRGQEEDPLDNVTLAACIGQCTIARQCNFITYKIQSNSTGECRSYRISSNCHLDQDDEDCMVTSQSKDDMGVNLGDCAFSAKPEGSLGDKGWALFRKVRSSTSDGLAVVASLLTIMTAVLGAPCTVLSRLFKA